MLVAILNRLVERGKEMTKAELIKTLDKFSDDDVVIISFGDGGWSNIETVVQDGSRINIIAEISPVFSDN